MRLLKYLGEHKGAIALVLVLLIAQAFCDLMLPNYTSRIVDVGIQQAGIERVAPSEMSSATYESLEGMLGAEGAALLDRAYDPNEKGTYDLVAQGEDDAALDIALARSFAQVHGLNAQGASDDIALQAGIAAAREEYELLGYDMNAMRINYLVITGAKMLGFALLASFIAVMVGLVASRTGAKIGRSLRSRLFRRVMSFSDAEIQRFSPASLITRGTNDIQQIQMMSIMMMRMVLYAPILGIGGIIMMAQTDLSMGWIIGMAVLVIVIIVAVLMFVAVPKFKIMQKLVDRVNLVAREMLTGVSVVRAFGRQEREQERFDEASTDLMRNQLFVGRAMSLMLPLMFLVLNIVSITIIWVGAGQVDAGVVQTGDLIAFITYAMIIIMGFFMLSMIAVIAPRANVSAARIDEVIETEPSIADPEEPKGEAPQMAPFQKEPLGESALSASQGARIAFENVSFRYAEDSEDVLHDVTFAVEPGQVCAVIGSTGSGKSTIAKLLLRFYDVGEGAVTIDGVDVRALPLHELRSQIGYVPQKAFLFTGTIGSNVGYASDDMDEAKMMDAIRIAQASELLESKEEGLGAPITQGGTNVSGGQRQRLAIARALASDARVLLFDDSFSALDYRTDAALREALANELPGKTQVIIAQRIATVMRADTIIVLDEGRVVGAGTHGQLLQTCQQYREIASSQLSPEELGLDLAECAPEGGGWHERA